MKNDPQEIQSTDSVTSAAYASKTESLQRRVNAAARAMSDKGVRPTVTRIRAALGGGSPNDLAPALKHWRESVGSTAGMDTRDSDAFPRIPVQIADLAHELWQRANAAAEVELKGGAAARTVVTRTEETESLRGQVSGLRDQLQRESLAFGELRAQAARYEAMALNALGRADEADARERKHLRDLGAARQRIAELEAAIGQLHEKAALVPSIRRKRRSPVKKMRRRSDLGKARAKTRRIATPARKRPTLASRVTAIQRRKARRGSRS